MQVWTQNRGQIIGTGTLMLGWFAYTYLPNTIGVKYIHRTFKPGAYLKPIEKGSTKALLDQVVADIEASRPNRVRRENIKFLQTNGIYPVACHKGKSTSSQGAILLFPIGAREDVEEVFHYYVPSKAGEYIIKFCKLSDKAKKFLFARQVFYVEDTYNEFRTGLGLLLIAVGGYIRKLSYNAIDQYGKNIELIIKQQIQDFQAGRIRRVAYHLRTRITILKLCPNLFIPMCMCYLYIELTSAYNLKLEREADEKVAKLGDDYMEGGLEYYNKVVSSNIYQLSLGDTRFSNKGDLIESVRNYHVPYTARRNYFQYLIEHSK